MHKGNVYLYAYPVIFFIFARIKGCGIVVKRRGYAEAFVYKAFGAQLCCKRHVIPAYPKMHNLPVPTVGTDMP